MNAHVLARRSLFCALACVAATVQRPANAQVPVMVPIPAGSRCDYVTFVGQVGKSIGLCDDELVLGAGNALQPFGCGLLFGEDGFGSWDFETFLTAGGSSSATGTAVAIDGDWIAIGAPNDFDGEEFSERVSLWHRDASGWAPAQSVSDGLGADLYGSTLDLDGETLAVGAPLTGQNGDEARIFLYSYDGTSWVEDFESAGPVPFGSFGCSVSVSGDVAVLANPDHPTHQAVVFRRTGSTWSVAETIQLAQQSILVAEGFTRLGGHARLDGTTLLLRAEGPLIGGGTQRAVAVFEDTGSGFTFAQFLEPGDGPSGPMSFARDFAIDDDAIVVGAHLDPPRGAAYLFRRRSGTFTEEAKFVPMGGDTTLPGGTVVSPEFGYSVAISGDHVAFGARKDSSLITLNGAGYVLGHVQSPSEVQGFCFGDGGDQAGCTDCPCDNNAPAGTVGGCLNSDGSSAALAALGDASASHDTLRLEVARARPETLVLLLSGEARLPRDPTLGPCPVGSGVRSVAFDGLRCIGGGLRRHGARTSDSKGSIGDPTAGWGGPYPPPGGLIAQGGFVVGQQRYFQAVYRDVRGTPCNSGLNTTNALGVMVTP